jgi:hypothetical protein
MSLNGEFLKNPITFLRTYALSPPDGTAGQVIKSWTVPNAGNISSGANGLTNSTVSFKQTGGISKSFSSFKPHGLFPECLTVSVSPTRTSDDDFVQYWLPWDSLAITRYRLPPYPAALVDDDEDLEAFPRFFMTAGINGCSIFVDGPATQPTVYHAGITGTLARSAEAFWKEQLEECLRGTAREGSQPAGQVHSHEYMQADAPVIKRYMEWAQSRNPQGFPVEVQSCFGSVVGVRFGRNWSFYLQENVMIQDLQMMKSSQLNSRETDTGEMFYSTKDKGERVERRVITKERKYLPDKKTKIFVRAVHARCKCVRVSEIYPSRAFAGELKDFEVRAT